eukprot:9061501-Pyramimonas_sp.AAC.1
MPWSRSKGGSSRWANDEDDLMDELDNPKRRGGGGRSDRDRRSDRSDRDRGDRSPRGGGGRPPLGGS